MYECMYVCFDGSFLETLVEEDLNLFVFGR